MGIFIIDSQPKPDTAFIIDRNAFNSIRILPKYASLRKPNGYRCFIEMCGFCSLNQYPPLGQHLFYGGSIFMGESKYDFALECTGMRVQGEDFEDHESCEDWPDEADSKKGVFAILTGRYIANLESPPQSIQATMASPPLFELLPQPPGIPYKIIFDGTPTLQEQRLPCGLSLAITKLPLPTSHRAPDNDFIPF